MCVYVCILYFRSVACSQPRNLNNVCVHVCVWLPWQPEECLCMVIVLSQGCPQLIGNLNKVHVYMYVCTTYVYSAVAVVPGNPLHNYCGHHNQLCPLCIICSFGRLNSMQCCLMPSGGGPLALTWECDRTNIVKVYIKYMCIYLDLYCFANLLHRTCPTLNL